MSNTQTQNQTAVSELPYSDPMETKFQQYLRENPQVWAEFERFTFEAIRAGRTRFGAQVVLERMRWHSMVSETGGQFKVNNNWAAYFARKFMLEHPEHDGLFSTRRSRANYELSSGA